MSSNTLSANWLKPDFTVLKQVFSGYGKVFVNWKGNKIPCTTKGHCEIFPDGTPYYSKGDPRYRVDDPQRKTHSDYEFWSTLDEAAEACISNPNINGVGIRLSKYLDTVCIDLDEVEDVTTDDRVKALMAMFPSYTEVSTSGHGIHIFIKGSKGSITASKKTVDLDGISTKLEIYDSDRYMITTGHAIGECREIRDCNKALRRLLEQFREDDLENTVIEIVSEKDDSTRPDTICAQLMENPKTAALMKYNKNALKEFFKVEKYEDADLSSLDMSLMNEIAYLTCDYNKAVEVFKRSDLYAHRLQTDYAKANRPDYFERTFSKAQKYINLHPRIDSRYCANDKDVLALKKSLVNKELTDMKFAEYLYGKGLFAKVRVMTDMKNKFVQYSDAIGCWDFEHASDSLVRPRITDEILRLVDIIHRKYHDALDLAPISSYLTTKLNKTPCDNLIGWFRQEPGLQMSQSDFEKPERVAKYINFLDKKLNLETAAFEDNDPEDYSSKSCDIRVSDYLEANGTIRHDSTVYDYIHAFFTPTIGPESGVFDEELYNYFLQALGAGLYGSIKEKVVFFLSGPANTGKSVLMDCLGYALNLLGGRRKYFSHLESSFITVDRKGGNNDALVNLQGVRIARISEMSTDDKMLNEFIKNITGNDVLTGSRKYENAVTFANMTTLVIETNEMPTTKNGADNALFSRIKCIDCKHIVRPEEQDKELRTKLQKDLGGWLWLFVEAAKAYKEHGLQDCQKVIDSVKKYRTESSEILKWADQCLEVTGDENDFIPNLVLLEGFKEFLREEQGTDVFAGKIGTIHNTLMAAHPGKMERTRKPFMKVQHRGLTGIRMKNLEEEARDEPADSLSWDSVIPF